jgi:hypothetical protein
MRMPTFSPRQLAILLTAIVLLALALRTAAVLIYGVNDIVTYTESGLTAANVVAGQGYTFDFYGLRPEHPLQSFIPPVFTALIAFCLTTFADPPRTLELIQALLSSLTVLCLYFIAAKLANQTVGLLLALALAVYPVYVALAAIPISLTLTAFLVSLLLCACLVLVERGTVRAGLVVGFLLGLSILDKPTLLGWMPLLLLWLWLNARQDGLKLLKLLAAIVVLALLTVLPWTLRNVSLLGQLVLVSTNGGITFWGGNNPFTTGSGFDVDSALLDAYLGVPHDPQKPAIIGTLIPYPMPKPLQAQVASLSEADLDDALYLAGLEFIRDDPAHWLRLVATKLVGFWWFRPNVGAQYEASWTRYYQIIFAALLLFAVPGLLLSMRQWRRYSLLYLLIGYDCLICLVFTVQTRYRWEVEPYLVLFATLSVYFLLSRVRSSR